MPELKIIDHPLLQNKLSLLRDKNTGAKEFRELVDEITMMMFYEVTRDLPLKEATVETPVGLAKTKVLDGNKLAVVPILRAGTGMVEGVLKLMPNARVGHVGLYRDPDSLQPVQYYCKMPYDVDSRDVIILDPMLATGGTAAAAIQFLKNYEVKNIKLMVILACKDGIKTVHNEHPDVPIICACVDEKLDSHGYIVPGLGDAGDRLFGTK